MAKATFMAEDGSIIEDVEITHSDRYSNLVYYIDKDGRKRRTLMSSEKLVTETPNSTKESTSWRGFFNRQKTLLKMLLRA